MQGNLVELGGAYASVKLTKPSSRRLIWYLYSSLSNKSEVKASMKA